MSGLDQDWADTINEEYGTDFKPEVDDEEEELDDVQDDTSNQDDDKSGDDADKQDDADDETEDDDKGDEDKEGEDDEDKDKKDPADDVDDDEVPEKFATKDDIKAALREMDVEKKTYETEHKSMQAEVLDKLYPEGIDRVLRDSDGDPINGIDDLTKLVNPKTGDLFTEEEAGRWLLEAQQKLNQDIQQLETYASEIVDTNISLKDGSERVAELYGDLLATVPEMADKLLDAYSRTLVRDPKTGIVIKAPVDVVEFYSMALAPYKDVAELAAQKAEADKKAADEAAKKAAEEKKKQEKTNQREREDLKPKGRAKAPKSEDEEAWDDAYEDYFNS